MGLSAEDFDQDEDCDIFPENFLSVEIFESMSTQWRSGGMGGLVGLDYTALESVFRMHAVRRDRWKGLLRDVRVMEHAALNVMRSDE